MADCTTMLQALLHNAEVTARMLQEHDVIAACVQAAETEHAARIAAVATRQAANWGLLAGFSALAAAGIAYRAARMQMRLTEAQNRARRIAYQRHFHELVSRAIRNVDYILEDWDSYKKLINDELIERINKNSALINLNSELQANNWHNHALLNERAMQFIVDVPGYITTSSSLVDICTQQIEDLDSKFKTGALNGLAKLRAKLVELHDSVAEPNTEPQKAAVKRSFLSLWSLRP